jgi:RNA polymerase sigma-70 factor (ECF subfamily)
MTEGISLAIPATQAAADEVDLAALVETHAALLFRVAHSVLRNAAEAEDTVQDVFLRVLQHESSLPAIREMRPWLVRIAWNLALDRRRRIRPDQLDELFAERMVAATLPADSAFAESERIAAVLRELDQLPAKERQVLLLAALEELSTVEIAAITARSDSAVRALLFRARTRLRTRLKKAGHA